jgi:hypothetical protein
MPNALASVLAARRCAREQGKYSSVARKVSRIAVARRPAGECTSAGRGYAAWIFKPAATAISPTSPTAVLDALLTPFRDGQP